MNFVFIKVVSILIFISCKGIYFKDIYLHSNGNNSNITNGNTYW